MHYGKKYMNLIYLVTLLFLVSCKETTNEPKTDELITGKIRMDSRGIEQVWISPGTFKIGTSDSDITAIKNRKPPQWVVNVLSYEQPQHEVQLTKGYWIDKYEVTNAAFQAFVDDSGYYKTEFWSNDGKTWLNRQQPNNLPVKEGNGVDNHPRVNITWFEAEAYANWRNGSLPTEAEWEYAARGPQSLIYPYGNTFDSAKANVINRTSLTKSGSYPSGVSWAGVHDMSGNAMEWVKDWLDPNYYKLKEKIDPQGPSSGRIKIEKGGWWGSNEFVARSAYKHFEDPPEYKDGHIGFRIISR